MFATVRQLKIKQSFQGENAKLVHDELLPEARTIPGFVDYYLIYADSETEMSIGIFSDKKGADKFNEIASKFVKDRLRENVQLTKIYEGPVVAQTRTPTTA